MISECSFLNLKFPIVVLYYYKLRLVENMGKLGFTLANPAAACPSSHRPRS